MDRTTLDVDLRLRAGAIVERLTTIVDGVAPGAPPDGAAILAVADEIAALRDALAFADAIGPLGRS